MADRSVKDIAWLGGLLEGEGCFINTSKKYSRPGIQLMMTDLDTVIKAGEVLGAHKVIRVKQDTRTDKSLYRLNVYGTTAISWMQTLYPILSARRQSKIRELLSRWKTSNRSPYPERKSYSRGAVIMWENSHGR